MACSASNLGNQRLDLGPVSAEQNATVGSWSLRHEGEARQSVSLR